MGWLFYRTGRINTRVSPHHDRLSDAHRAVTGWRRWSMATGSWFAAPAWADEPSVMATITEHVTAGALLLPASLRRLLEVGGPVAWVLMLMSLALIAVIVFKLLHLAAVGLYSPFAAGRHREIVAAWESGEHELAQGLAKAGQDAGSRLLAVATKSLHEQRLDDRALESELTRAFTTSVGALRSQVVVLEVIANLAPMLGLLGTVLGMIEAFQAMERAGDAVDPAVLSAGIWKALLTTAIGLVVAVPAIVAHHAFEQRIERFGLTINDQMGRLTTASARRAGGAPDHRINSDELGAAGAVAVLARVRA